MKNKKRKKSLILSLAVLASFIINATGLYAQDINQDDHSLAVTIPEVALLDLESNTGTSIVLALEAPTEAGLPVSVENATDSSVWLNYSSVIGSTTEATRIVSVQLGSGTIAEGLKLRVRAVDDAGAGDGAMGTNNGFVFITRTSKTLITNIGTCYTGDGAGKGHNLTYALRLSNAAGKYAQIDFDEATTVTVVYTISNN